MLRFMQRTSNLVRFLLLILACSSIVARISSRTVESADLINGIQNPVIMTHSYPSMIKTIQEKMDNGEDRFCQIEYQVTRKRPGKCTRISDGISGCISEDYIDPFHPDCL